MIKGRGAIASRPFIFILTRLTLVQINTRSLGGLGMTLTGGGRPQDDIDGVVVDAQAFFYAMAEQPPAP